MRVASVILAAAAVAVAGACGSSSPSSPTSPSKPPLPVSAETDHYVFHAAAGDAIDTAWQEAYHAWAVARLGVQPSRKVGYYKYTSRQDMGDHTGSYSTNGYADVAAFEIHTLGSTDNHEVVHLLVSLVGDAPGLFSEGIAVALQTDPVKGVLTSWFNGEEVHAAARRYLQGGQLVLPLDRILENSAFRAITDPTLAYREAGSFVRFLIDRYGIDRVLAFFRGGSYTDTAAVVKARFRTVVGVTLEEAEAAWLEMLQAG
jgi:hypothetical protein